MRNRTAAGLAVASLLLVACADRERARTRVEQGVLRGALLPSQVVVFRGVPFAAPPIGEQRWRAPEPPNSWEDERAAITPAPACPQDDGSVGYYRRVARRLGRDTSTIPAVPPTSEDCLYLNIWTPSLDADAKLPVFVWIHGGAGTSGSANDPIFNGASLARRGLVVVTVAYRLGALGFLVHPALDGPRGAAGNYALLDILRALHWVRRNAAAFGGDSARVTLAGQSAGATLAHAVAMSPMAHGLVQRLVLQSGTATSDIPVARAIDAASAEVSGARFMAELGLGADADAASLRDVPVDSLLAAARRAPADAPSMPVVDSVVLLEQPADRIARGAFPPIPILAGSTTDEAALFAPPSPVSSQGYRAEVRTRFGDDARELLREYPPDERDGEFTRRQRVRLMSDAGFRAPLLALLGWPRAAAIYLYRFAWSPDDGTVGAFHSADLPFVFDTHGDWWPRTPTVEHLTAHVQIAWAQFAATGKPDAPGLPPWPVASVEQPLVMVLDSAPRVEQMARLNAVRLQAQPIINRHSSSGAR